MLLYFLLATGDLFLRKLVKVLPTLADKRRAFGRALRVSGVVDAAAVREYVAGLGSNTGRAGVGPHSEEK